MSNTSTRKEDVVDKAKSAISSNGSAIAEKFQTIASDAYENAKEVTEQIPETIRHYPLQSLAVGFGVGFLSALMIRKFA
jgi:ElaB/YqjD/DUF883 family membrane-anchored ribosome-binding protein